MLLFGIMVIVLLMLLLLPLSAALLVVMAPLGGAMALSSPSPATTDDGNGAVQPTSLAPHRPTTTRRTRRPSWRCGYRLLLLEFLLHAPTFSFGTTRGHNYALPVATMKELTRPRKKEEATVGNRVLSTLRRQLRYETKQVERNAGKRSCHNKWLIGWFLGARPFLSRMTNCTHRTTHP
jgi:hypothetical protein